MCDNEREEAANLVCMISCPAIKVLTWKVISNWEKIFVNGQLLTERRVRMGATGRSSCYFTSITFCFSCEYCEWILVSK